MRALLTLLLLAVLAVTLALFARYNDGYLLLVVPPWRIELSLNFFLLLLATLFVLLHLGLRAIAAATALRDRKKPSRRSSCPNDQASRAGLHGRQNWPPRRASSANSPDFDRPPDGRGRTGSGTTRLRRGSTSGTIRPPC